MNKLLGDPSTLGQRSKKAAGLFVTLVAIDLIATFGFKHQFPVIIYMLFAGVLLIVFYTSQK